MSDPIDAQIRERALRRELALARHTRPRAVPLILAELGEAPAIQTRGGGKAQDGPAKPSPRAKK